MLGNPIGTYFDVSKVGNCTQLEESFWKIPDEPHTFEKCLADAIKELCRFYEKETL
jgi:hypothetical protein